jgi:glycerol-3-phosphate acyltransferase PlsY
MPSPWWYVAIFVAYLIGAVPFGLLIGLSRGVDIREAGSGNIGATNVGRLLGRKLGLVCFGLDVLKGLGPAAAAGGLFGWVGGQALTAGECGQWLGVGMAALLGHIFPVYLKFRGGKGVATGFGVIVGIWPYLTVSAIAGLVTWVLFAGSLRYVGLASVVAALTLPAWYGLAARLFGWPIDQTWPFIAVTALMALVVLVRHRGNLARTWRGTESQLGE